MLFPGFSLANAVAAVVAVVWFAVWPPLKRLPKNACALGLGATSSNSPASASRQSAALTRAMLRPRAEENTPRISHLHLSHPGSRRLRGIYVRSRCSLVVHVSLVR